LLSIKQTQEIITENGQGKRRKEKQVWTAEIYGNPGVIGTRGNPGAVGICENLGVAGILRKPGAAVI
jgi:hypothetical protein